MEISDRMKHQVPMVLGLCCVLAASWLGCSRKVEPTAQIAPAADSSLERNADYFIANYGKPAQVEKFKDHVEAHWKNGNLTTRVIFSADGTSEKIVYTLSTTRWTDQQIAAALTKNGSNWQRLPFAPNASPLTQIGVELTGMGQLLPRRWRSAEGHEAMLAGAQMTLKSNRLLAREAQEAAAAKAKREVVPRF